MSRLESFIRRLEAQRACLDLAARLIAALPGNVLEFGLGNGRTFDHLRSLFSSRDIFVFDRQVAAHPDCIPAADRLFVGDFIDTLPRAATLLGANSALAHLDVGSGDVTASRSLASAMMPYVLRLLKPGALVVSDQPIIDPGLESMALPAGIEADRYYLSRRL